MTENVNAEPILVIGASGTTGRRVVELLRRQGRDVRSASRSSEWQFDWLDSGTWDRVLSGVRTAYVVQHDADNRTEALIGRAKELGLRRLVLLSGRGVDDPDYFDDPEFTADEFLNSERALRDSGLEWTVIRPGWFMQNFSDTFFRAGVLAGEMRLPMAHSATSFVDADDIAAVAVAALTEDGHTEQTYELSGPRALTFTEAADEISHAIGRTVTYTPVSSGEYVSELTSSGVPDGDAYVYSVLLSPIRNGKDQHLSDGVQRALGREPKDFTDFAAEAAKAGAWDNGDIAS